MAASLDKSLRFDAFNGDTLFQNACHSIRRVCRGSHSDRISSRASSSFHGRLYSNNSRAIALSHRIPGSPPGYHWASEMSQALSPPTQLPAVLCSRTLLYS